jgi:hypothetical protein
MPPIMPVKREWREAVLEAVGNQEMEPFAQPARHIQ